MRTKETLALINISFKNQTDWRIWFNRHYATNTTLTNGVKAQISS